MTDFGGNIFTMESFTDTTDGSGDITVALTETPAADDAIIAFTTTAKRVVEFVSRSGVNVTLRFRKLTYDKATAVDGTGSLTDLPTSVTEDSTSGGFVLTTSAAPSASLGQNFSINSAPAGHTHTVTVNKAHSHGHDTITSAETDLTLATSESVKVTVGYAYA